MDERKDEQHQSLERRYTIRKISQVQPSWREHGPGEAGRFYLQLILDHGVEEYILMPNGQDAQTLLNLFLKGVKAQFDIERKIVIFDHLDVK
jgi:hypothetical protein